MLDCFFRKDLLLKYYKKCGIKIGENPRIFSNILTTEPYLIEIGDNVTISNNVQLITHDNSIIKALPGVTDIFGRVKIGNNCFIGARSIIMYGCELADNTIVASGSVVTKSVKEPGKIVAGNPARVVGDVKSFADKYADVAVNIKGLSAEEKYDLLVNQEKGLVRK